jgi:NAD(P)-dependent dehydrogenase (short-subunit alcohol dehydrogenase family)
VNLEGKVAVVTGGAGGIGSALARRFVQEGAKAVVVADVREAADLPERTRAVVCDTADDAAVKALIDDVESREGPIDLYCANAGIAVGADVTTADDVWNQVWHVNVMGSVVAARHLVPRWVERGDGYLLVTASAAGLLTTLGDAAYAATKHAAVGLAEWIAITYGDRGVKVSCLCPQGVKTRMVLGDDGEGQLGTSQVKALGLIEPEEVADAVVEALAEERFLVLPHPEVLQYFRNKADNYGRWIGGMRKFQRSLSNPSG